LKSLPFMQCWIRVW